MGDISANFSLSEYECPCCGLNLIDMRIVTVSEIVRHFEGDKPMSLNSACRCLEHNERIQKKYNKKYKPYSSRSKHMPFTPEGVIDEKTGICKAGDFPSRNPFALYTFLDRIFGGIYGIGVYSWGVHVDVALRYARWDNR